MNTPSPPSSPRAPWVAILTPVYNGWEYLEECALSIFLQKAVGAAGGPPQPWEWWIGVNGHGDDGGPALAAARRVQEIHAVRGDLAAGTVHVVNLPDVRGKPAALNALVPLTSAPWIAVLDCDDGWDRDKLFQQWTALQGPAASADVIGTWCWYFGAMTSGGPPLPAGWISAQQTFEANPLINSSALIRRELAWWSDAWFGLDDYELWLRLATERRRLYNVPQRLVYHRIHPTSAFNASGRQDVAGLRAFWAAKPVAS